jgi:hypothetical protein
VPQNPPPTPLLIGLHAARANLVPGLIVQALMLAVVLGYYFVPAAQGPLNALARIKQSLGIPFAIGAAIFAGALAPEILKVFCFQGGRPNAANLRTFAVAAILWGTQGVIVDYMYRLQAVLFGDEVSFRAIAPKVALDQFVFNPCLAAIMNTITYDLLHRGFTWANFRSCLSWRYYKAQVIPILIATWGVWIPVVCGVYSLPQPLQFPLFTLALTFWATMLAWIGGVQSRTHQPAPAPCATAR